MVRVAKYFMAGAGAGAGVLLSACQGAAQAPDAFAGTTTYIVHGYMAGPDDHWFEWLEREIEAGNGEAVRLDLPRSDDPDPRDWKEVLSETVGSPDRNTYIVAHSLGAITTLRYLSALEGHERLGGVLLVSGFSGELATIPALDSYMAEPFDAGKIRQMTDDRVIISAQDDPIVPHLQSKALADEVGADFLSVETGGHFLAADGFTEFPLVIHKLKAMVAKSN